MATRPCADSCFLLLWSRGKFSKNPDPTTGRETSFRLLVLVFFFFFRVEILLDILADNTKKKQVPWGPSFQGNLTAAPAALLTPAAVVRTHNFQRSSSHGWGDDRRGFFLEIISWELTYPPKNHTKKGTFEDDVPFPQVGYGLVPWRVAL